MKNGKDVRKVMNRRYIAYQNKRFWLKIAYSDKLFEIIFGYLGKFLYFCSQIKKLIKLSLYLIKK